jgi:hypothetical protein
MFKLAYQNLIVSKAFDKSRKTPTVNFPSSIAVEILSVKSA